MKLFATVSFVLTFLFLSVNTFAQIQYYGIEAELNQEGRTLVNMTITFTKPETNFTFNVLGKVEKFQIKSIAGPANCSFEVSGVTLINCNLGLTQEKRTIDISFETNDFVRPLESKYFYSADVSLNKNIDQLYSSVTLPEGMALSGDKASSEKVSFPQNLTTISDGRRIILIWKMSDFKAADKIRFEFLYERLPSFLPSSFRLRYVAVFGAAVAAVFGFIWLRYFRKPEKMILSVLDDFERKVMDIIVAHNGEVNQRKIVQETNFSKAKISRVVKSLSERGLVQVERLGRTNKLKLIKKKFQL